MLIRTTLLVFVAASLTCVFGCVTVSDDEDQIDPFAREEGIEIIKKGDPAPNDGFWMSQDTFLMLYEAAERTAAIYGNPVRTEVSTAETPRAD